MGTSLSGLTPATTFDGLLKVGDNDPLTATLKPISTGDGTDTMLELSTSALQIGGATGMYWDNTNKRLGIATDAPSVPFEVYGNVRFRNDLNLNGRIYNSASNKVNINNLVYIQSNVGIGESTPTSRLHVKGSGATSATTSLLVQNSAGTDMLKVQDDGVLNVSDNIIMGSGKAIFSGDSGHGIYLNGFSSMLFRSNTKDFVWTTQNGTLATLKNDGDFGIGETTPTARLHVKGSGNDNTTTSLLVQNSDAENIMAITDDGYLTYRTPQRELLTLGNGSVLKYGTNSSFSALYNRASIYDGTNTTQFENGNVGIGNGTTTPTARLQVKGSGATSATTALLVENSAGTELLKVVDDGQLEIKSNSGRVSTTSGTSIFSYSSGGGGVLDVNPSNNNSVKFRARGDNDTFLIQTNPAGDNVGIGASSPDSTAKLQVDSTTQGFLPPRMTDAERDAISTPAAGLMVYNTTTNKAQCYNGTAWQDLF